MVTAEETRLQAKLDELDAAERADEERLRTIAGQLRLIARAANDDEFKLQGNVPWPLDLEAERDAIHARIAEREVERKRARGEKYEAAAAQLDADAAALLPMLRERGESCREAMGELAARLATLALADSAFAALQRRRTEIRKEFDAAPDLPKPGEVSGLDPAKVKHLAALLGAWTGRRPTNNHTREAVR